MKEIKFRAFIDNKMVFYPHPQLVCNNIGMLMQFTGLKDKNGKDIYEGDIIKTEKGNGQVKYYDAYACFGLLGRMHYAMIPIARIAYENPEMIKNLEVIGNIYENPDLLKEAYAQPNV